MNEWSSTTLGELAVLSGGSIHTGPFGSQLHASDYVSDGVPSVMPANIGDNRIIEDGIARVGPTDVDRLSRHKLRTGDIVYSRRGDVERRALVRPENDGWLCGTGCLRVRFGDSHGVDPTFISYLLGTQEVREWIVRHAVGATMLNLNTGILSEVPLSMPPFSEQRAIAEVLGALDDKIAANAKLAATMQELGRALYSEACRSAPTRVTLSAVAKNVPGRYLAKSDYADDGPYFIYGSNSVMGKHDKALCMGGFSVLAKIGSYCGSLRWSQRPAWVNNNASAIVPQAGITPSILRHALESIDMAPHRAGSGQPYIRMDSLFATQIEVPSDHAALSIGPVLEQLTEAETVACEENQGLGAIRDALLPQLMSGKLRVKDAEKVVGAAV